MFLHSTAAAAAVLVQTRGLATTLSLGGVNAMDYVKNGNYAGVQTAANAADGPPIGIARETVAGAGDIRIDLIGPFA